MFTKKRRMRYNTGMSDRTHDLGLKCRQCGGALQLSFG